VAAPLPRVGVVRNLRPPLWFLEYRHPELGFCRCYYATRKAAQRAQVKAEKRGWK
jgi:hypothetical protein